MQNKICKTICILPVSTHVKFYQDLIASFSITVEQSLTKRWPGKRKKERRKKE